MSSEQLTAMNGFTSKNYPGLYRKAYQRTSYCGYGIAERQRQIMLKILDMDPEVFGRAVNAAVSS